MKEFRVVNRGMHGIYGAGKTMDETFGLVETVEKAAQNALPSGVDADGGCRGNLSR